MPKTRSKGPPAAAGASITSTSSKYTLPAESDNPHKLFVLPKKATSQAKVVSLPNPRYSKPSRYLVCPETGFYEFTRVSAPKSAPRSWLIESCSPAGDQKSDEFKAQIRQSADIYVASPVDPLFLVLPALAAKPPSKSDNPKRMFLASDDHFDSLPEEHSHLSEILRWGQTRSLLEARMAVVCDKVDAGDDPMFRLNEDKLANELLAKALKMREGGFPKSMQEKFVTRALEAPVMSIRSTPGVPAAPQKSASSPCTGVSTPVADSQSTVSSVDATASFTSEASTAATTVAEDATENNEIITAAIQASPEVTGLQELRVAFNFICSSYLPPTLADVLKKWLASQKDVDFTPLDGYINQLAKLRQEAALLRSASDFSRKRAREEEDEERAEKKQKKEDEEKRKKAGESRGIRDLKKVNVSGMKKMSDFFKKKVA